MFGVAGNMCWACLAWFGCLGGCRPTSISLLSAAGCCAQRSVSNNGEGSSLVHLVKADKHQALHLGSSPHLPDTLSRRFLLQGAPKKRQRLSRAERAIGPGWTANVLPCSWDALETEISYWCFTRVTGVDLCLLCCQAAVWGWYQRLLGDGLCVPIRAAQRGSVKS